MNRYISTVKYMHRYLGYMCNYCGDILSTQFYTKTYTLSVSVLLWIEVTLGSHKMAAGSESCANTNTVCSV